MREVLMSGPMEIGELSKRAAPNTFFPNCCLYHSLVFQKGAARSKEFGMDKPFFPRKVDVLMLTLHSTTAGTGLAAFGLRIPEVRPVGRGAVAD